MTTPNTLFRKKPVEVEAFQLPAPGVDVPDAFHEWCERVGFSNFESGRDETLLITTPEGVMEAQPRDWIICGVMGEFYPCKPEVFAATYAPAARPSSEADDEPGYVETVIACLGDDAAALRSENSESEVAENMERAADLLAALASPLAVQVAEALTFYAEGNHFIQHEPTAWDTVSGEPQNFFEDEANTATVEDGSIARIALAALAEAAPAQQAADAAPTADGPPLEGLAHFHYRLEATSGYEQEGVYNNITADGFGRVIAALEGARDDGRAELETTQGEGRA